MQPVTVHPPSVLVGVALAVLGALALGAQSVTSDRLLKPPGDPDVYYPPIPIGELTYLPAQAWATDATPADVVTVEDGQHLAIFGQTGFSAGQTFQVVRWPLTQPFEIVESVGSLDAFGMPSVILGPGQYVFGGSGGDPVPHLRFDDGVFGHLVRRGAAR